MKFQNSGWMIKMFISQIKNSLKKNPSNLIFKSIKVPLSCTIISESNIRIFFKNSHSNSAITHLNIQEMRLELFFILELKLLMIFLFAADILELKKTEFLFLDSCSILISPLTTFSDSML